MNIGICGAGAMGSGIAYTALLAGHTVLLFDLHETAHKKAESFIVKQFSRAVEKGKMTKEEAEASEQLLDYSDTLEHLRESDLVIEAIVENRAVKQDLFAKLEGIVSEECILASNTSSISITSLASVLKRAERFVGLHFFNPAHIMPLVEVIRGAKTADSVVETCVALARELGKTPVIAKDVPGFIVNRVARNFYNEAMRICTEGASDIEQVDGLMKSAGFKMGPFELMDLIGNDVNFEVTKSMWEQYFYEPRFQPSLMQQQLVEAKLFGRKTGEGFYKYDEK